MFCDPDRGDKLTMVAEHTPTSALIAVLLACVPDGERLMEDGDVVADEHACRGAGEITGQRGGVRDGGTPDS